MGNQHVFESNSRVLTRSIWRQHLSINSVYEAFFFLAFWPMQTIKTETQRGMSFVLLTHVLVYSSTYVLFFPLAFFFFYFSVLLTSLSFCSAKKNIFSNFQSQELNAFGSMIEVTHNIDLYSSVCLYNIFL